jgi:hypothetical protein
MLFNETVIEKLTNLVEKPKLLEQYEFARTVKDIYKYDIEQSIVCIEPISKKVKQKFYFGELKNWLNWVNKNIILKLGEDNMETSRIKLRICTSMLNKIELDRETRINILDNLAINVNNDLATISLEDLPF